MIGVSYGTILTLSTDRKERRLKIEPEDSDRRENLRPQPTALETPRNACLEDKLVLAHSPRTREIPWNIPPATRAKPFRPSQFAAETKRNAKGHAKRTHRPPFARRSLETNLEHPAGHQGEALSPAKRPSLL